MTSVLLAVVPFMFSVATVLLTPTPLSPLISDSVSGWASGSVFLSSKSSPAIAPSLDSDSVAFAVEATVAGVLTIVGAWFHV